MLEQEEAQTQKGLSVHFKVLELTASFSDFEDAGSIQMSFI